MKGAQVAITVVIMLATAFLGLYVIDTVASSEYNERIEAAQDRAKAWCEYKYNDSGVYSAAVVGNHGGLHCTAHHDDPHYHEVREPIKQAVYRAYQRGERPDMGGQEIYKNRYTGPFPATVNNPIQSLSIVLLSVVVVAALIGLKE